MMKFTQIPTDTFSTLQLNAGILLSGAEGFNPSTGVLSTANIIGATSGGVKASCVPSFIDFGDNVDNCPKNTMELKRLDNWECKISGTFVTVSTTMVKIALGAADYDSSDTTKVNPRSELSTSDFTDVWFVGDYSDKNGVVNGGFVAIHLMNALSSGGFSMQTGDKEKGEFQVEFTGHFSMNALDVVPMEFFIQAGTAEPVPTPPVVYEYVPAELTDGFEYGITYYTRSGESEPYTYTEVEVGAEYDSEVTYYIRQVVQSS